MIFLKRRALMTRASFNYKTVSGIGSAVLENCVETKFKRLVLSGNSKQTSTTGSQLFDIENIDDTTCVTTIPNQAFAYDQLYVLSNMIPVKQGEKIVKGNTRSTMCIFLNLEKQPILSTKTKLNDNTSIEVPEGAHYFCFNVLKTNLNKEVMCNIGTSILPYEPYTGGKPSPSVEYPQGIINAGDSGQMEVKITGKNLFDISKNKYKCDEEKICIPSKPLAEINITAGITFEEKTAYFLSWESYTITKPNDQWTPIFGVEYTDKAREEFYMHFYKNGTKTNANKTIKYVYIQNPWSVGTDISRIQIEKGTKRTEYEPFKLQTLTIPLDEPLRGICENKDIVTKDGILRNIKEIIFDENAEFKIDTGEIQIKTTAFISPVISDATPINLKQCRMICDRFKVLISGFDTLDEECCVLYNKRFIFRLNKERADTVEKLKEWLKQNPIKIQYLLQESVLEPFENSLDSLYSNDGTTIITVDSGEVKTGIEVEYAVKS